MTSMPFSSTRITARQICILGRDSGKEPFLTAEPVPQKQSAYRKTNGNIAAIDFGTTSVSLAYTTYGSSDVNTLPLDTTNMDTRITNGILLETKPDGSYGVASFGHNARGVYSKVRNRENYVYFERIKMLMKREKKIDRESCVESFSGAKFYLVEVVAFILRYLKDYFLEHLGKIKPPPILKATDFDWVITVPAIWDPRGKRMMREAAYLAGLLTSDSGISSLTPFGQSLPCPQETNSDHLTLALEPECAALYSQTITEVDVANAANSEFPQPKGAYMVLDIGGGTVDITAQIKRDDGHFEVINVPSGNDWGGTRVNKQFSKMFQEIVDDENFEKFLSSGDREKRQIVLNELFYREFELQKVTFGDAHDRFDQHDEMGIIIPRSVVDFYGAELIEKGAGRIPGVEYVDDSDCLYIESSVVEEKLFGPVVEQITSCVMIAIDSTTQVHGDIDTYYFVGGFGGCKYLYQSLCDAITKKYGSLSHMIVPKSPKLAIAQGAVIWRRCPDNISSRCIDATYGISLQMPFNSDVHDDHYRVYNEEQQQFKCKDVYSVFRQRGDVVKSNEAYLIDGIAPAYQGMSNMKFEILSTVDRGVQYVEDKDGEMVVTKIGELVIDIPNEGNLPRSKRLVDVTVDFSGTEIQAKAKYRVTGEEVKVLCDFLSVAKPFQKN